MQYAEPVTGFTAASRHFAGAAGVSADWVAVVSAGWVAVSADWATAGSNIATPNATMSVLRCFTISSPYAFEVSVFAQGYQPSAKNDIKDV